MRALGLDNATGGPTAAGNAAAVSRIASLRAPAAADAEGRAVSAPQQPPAPPAPPKPATDALPGGSQRTDRQFTGNPVSLDFQGADLRAVLRTFAEISGLNIVIDPTVHGTVDVALRDVPWDQALDIILRANKLGYLIDGTIVRIAPLTVLADEETQRRKLGDEQALAGQLAVLTQTLSYAKAEESAGAADEELAVAARHGAVDPRTNTLIITDLQDNLARARDLITTLDRAQPQVEIEARIVQTNKNYARALGVQWGFGGHASPTLGNTTNLAFPNSGSVGQVGATQGATGSTADMPTAVNLAAPGATSAVGLALGSVNGAFNLDVALSALETSGNGDSLDPARVDPEQRASRNDAGRADSDSDRGEQHHYGGVQGRRAHAEVTPQITAVEHRHHADLPRERVRRTSADRSTTFRRSTPNARTRRCSVSDGQTTVIGGIYTDNGSDADDSTPGLSHIPFLSWLFKRDTINDQSQELPDLHHASHHSGLRNYAADTAVRACRGPGWARGGIAVVRKRRALGSIAGLSRHQPVGRSTGFHDRRDDERDRGIGRGHERDVAGSVHGDGACMTFFPDPGQVVLSIVPKDTERRRLPRRRRPITT